MLFKRYVSTSSNMYSQNIFNKFVIIVLVGLLISQQIMLRNAFRDNKVFLIPPGLNAKTAVSGKSLDAAYLKPMGAYVANLLYAFIPSSVIGQYSEITTYMTPDGYNANSKSLLKLASDYKDNDVSASLQITGIKIFSNPEMIEVEGDVTKYITAEPTDKKHIKVDITYAVDNGMFRIKSIQEKK